jgi:hypothetical protein
MLPVLVADMQSLVGARSKHKDAFGGVLFL